jgi:hypothetical protein
MSVFGKFDAGITVAPSIDELRKHYSQVAEGRLLELATERQDLSEIAKMVLHEELQRRGITEIQISKFAAYLRDYELAEQAEAIASRVNGCGTAILDQEDEREDGSFVVTKWFTLFWIPLIRLEKMRIKPVTLTNGRPGYLVFRTEPYRRSQY